MNDSFIYKWTDINTGMVYIGSHKGDLNDGYICSSKYMLCEYNQRPADFSRIIIEHGKWEDVRIKEDIMIRDLWENNVPCYNKGTGGTFKITAESRKAMSLAGKGKPKSKEHKEKLKEANRRKAKDPEFLKKLRKPNTEEHNVNISKGLSGIPKSPSHRKSISDSKKGKATGPCSENRRKAISESLSGRESKFKGMTYEEIMGKEKADKLKIRRAVSMKEMRKNLPELTCPYCGLIGKGSNMSRWHFDNCKKRK